VTDPLNYESWLQKAEGGDASAQYFLALMYREGRSVNKNYLTTLLTPENRSLADLQIDIILKSMCLAQLPEKQ
jgi:TPR repeat protein